jgi:hypothetical protein
MSDLPIKIDLLYKRGILNQKEWRRLLNCLLALDGLKLEGKYPREAQEYAEEIVATLIKKLEKVR